MPKNIDLPWQLYVLKNYDGGKILTAWNELRRLSNGKDMNPKKKWRWAVVDQRIKPYWPEVQRLKAEYEQEPLQPLHLLKQKK